MRDRRGKSHAPCPRPRRARSRRGRSRAGTRSPRRPPARRRGRNTRRGTSAASPAGRQRHLGFLLASWSTIMTDSALLGSVNESRRAVTGAFLRRENPRQRVGKAPARFVFVTSTLFL